MTLVPTMPAVVAPVAYMPLECLQDVVTPYLSAEDKNAASLVSKMWYEGIVQKSPLPKTLMSHIVTFLDHSTQKAFSESNRECHNTFLDYAVTTIRKKPLNALYLKWKKGNLPHTEGRGRLRNSQVLGEIRRYICQDLHDYGSNTRSHDNSLYIRGEQRLRNLTLNPMFINGVNQATNSLMLLQSEIIKDLITEKYPELAPASPLMLVDSFINPVYQEWVNENMTEVNLEGKKLPILPLPIYAFSGIKSLNIANNCLIKLPQLGTFREMKTLNVSDNEITVISNINWPPGLEILDLSGNPLNTLNLESLPSTIRIIILDPEQIRLLPFQSSRRLPIFAKQANPSIVYKFKNFLLDYAHQYGTQLRQAIAPLIVAVGVEQLRRMQGSNQ